MVGHLGMQARIGLVKLLCLGGEAQLRFRSVAKPICEPCTRNTQPDAEYNGHRPCNKLEAASQGEKRGSERHDSRYSEPNDGGKVSGVHSRCPRTHSCYHEGYKQEMGFVQIRKQ